MVICGIGKKKAGAWVREDDGYIVVETIGAFVPFVLLVISILSLVNIVTVQARVHYAMTQTANTLSMYSYTLEVLGVAKNLTALSNKAERAEEKITTFKDNIKGVLTGLDSFSDIESSIEHGENAINQITDAVSDPKALLQDVLNYTVEDLRNRAFEQLARPLVGRYLSNGDMTGDEYLQSVGVVKMNSDRRVVDKTGLGALEFYRAENQVTENSVLIDSKGNVKLVVIYEIEYKFGGLPLPFHPTLKVTQTVSTKAWLNGSGKGYE